MGDVRKVFVLFCCFYKSRRPHGPFLGALLLATVLAACTGSAASADVEPKIVALAGETVLLPCNTTASDDVPTVEWTKLGSRSIVAFLYRHGCETFEMKDLDFQYRTHLIMHKLHRGNHSMLMSNVQLRDSGKYQCMIRSKQQQVIRRLELFVGAVSEPRLSVVPGVGGGLTLQCEARCWFPKPLITLIDNQGNEISAEDQRINVDSSGCFTVIRRGTLQTATNRVTCRVHQPEINQSRDSEIYIPDEYLRSCTSTTAVVTTIVVVCICAGVAFLVKRHYFSGGQPKSSSGNRDKDTTGRNSHKSKPSPVQQPRQFINGPKFSPGTSKRDIPPPPKSTYSSTPPKPASSADSGHPQSGNLPQTNDSKPVVSGQNPAFMKKSIHDGTSAASTTDGAAPPVPPPDPKEKPLPRSRSMSEKQPRVGGVRSPRRNTLSVMSSNRFSVLSDLTEDSEDAKPLI